MTHDQTTPAPVDVTRMDHDRALEVFNDILCDMGNYVEFGAPHYKHEALETIASHCARHRIAHSAPAGEVTQVDRATRTARFLADQKAAAAALASLPDSTRARLEAWQTAQSEWFDGTVLEIVAEFIAFENTRHSSPAGEVEPVACVECGGGGAVLEMDRMVSCFECRGSGEKPASHPAPPADLVELVEALRELLHAYCSDTGFAAAVRQDTGLAYPWAPGEIAEARARAALAKHGGA